MDSVRINRDDIPPEEHEAAKFIEENLCSLQTRAQDFRHTLSFFLHIRELAGADPAFPMKVPWTKIAGRNGAIEAYGFAMVMELINEMPPTIRARIDKNKKREATRLFATEFPRIAAIRHSTAHPGELIGDPKELEKHRLKEPTANEIVFAPFENSNIFMTDGMKVTNDRLVFSSTFQGKLASYELSHAKADVLDQIAQLYNEAFYPLQEPSAAERRTRNREIDAPRAADQSAHQAAPYRMGSEPQPEHRSDSPENPEEEDSPAPRPRK